MKTWYRMAAAAGDAPAEIAIYDEIGLWGITAADFRDDLKALGSPTSIDLRINSPGGEVFDSLAIFNMLASHRARVTAYVDGWAASAAGLVAMAGAEVLIAENAWIMVHNPWAVLLGEAEDLRKQADLLDGMKQQAIRIYQRHTKLSAEQISDLMDAETWMEGSAAVAQGFATGTFAAAEVAASAAFDPSHFVDSLHAPAAARRIFTTTTPARPAKERTMPPRNDETPPETGEPDPATDPPETATAQLAAERQALSTELAAVRAERLAARRERTQAAVARDLEQLGSRLTPAMRRAGTRNASALEAALVELRLAEDGPTIHVEVERSGQVAQADVSAYDVVLAALRAAPEFTALGAGALATDDGDTPPAVDRRTAEQRAYDRSRGLSDEDAVRIQAAHPGAFGAN